MNITLFLFQSEQKIIRYKYRVTTLASQNNNIADGCAVGHIDTTLNEREQRIQSAQQLPQHQWQHYRQWCVAPWFPIQTNWLYDDGGESWNAGWRKAWHTCRGKNLLKFSHNWINHPKFVGRTHFESGYELLLL